jgi:C1A family cysteine protease
MLKLEALQSQLQAQEARWTAAKTSVSELSEAQMKMRLGLKVTPEELAATSVKIEAARAALRSRVAAAYPPSWNWRNANGYDWTTPIKDQMTCGSCVAFGVIAVIESQMEIVASDPQLNPNLSEACLFYCGCGECCDIGWNFPPALNYARDSGICDEDCFPYQDSYIPCDEGRCADWQDRLTKIKAWHEILDPGDRKEWLATQGPLVGGMAVYDDFFSYSGGIYSHMSGGLAGYHAIAVVGYNDTDAYWICKNSWGTGWGESGWFRIAYGQCSLDTQFAGYGVEYEYRPPERDLLENIIGQLDLKIRLEQAALRIALEGKQIDLEIPPEEWEKRLERKIALEKEILDGLL